MHDRSLQSNLEQHQGYFVYNHKIFVLPKRACAFFNISTVPSIKKTLEKVLHLDQYLLRNKFLSNKIVYQIDFDNPLYAISFFLLIEKIIKSAQIESHAF